MAEPSPQAPRDSVGKTMLVALLVSLACSSLVASAAVLLRPYEAENRRRDIQRNILQVAGLPTHDAAVDDAFEWIETVVVDLETGAVVDSADPARFDPREAARDPERSVPVPAAIDRARVGRRATWGLVHLRRGEAGIERIVLPISGYGLWSTMYGFIALEPDATTVADIAFYAHGETPGLGDQIGEPAWTARWQGKRVYDQSETPAIEVVKGAVSSSDPLRDYRVDGISGATLTGNGVTEAVRYWLGDHGYGPYLRTIRGEER